MRRLNTVQNEMGGILVIALLVLVLMSLIGIVATSNSNTEIKIAGNHKTSIQAFYLAEAGIEHAKAMLRAMSFNDVLHGEDNDKDATEDNGRPSDLQNRTFGGGRYSVYITDRPAAHANGSIVYDEEELWEDSDNRIFITCLGAIGNAEQVIQVELEKTSIPVNTDGALAIYTPSPTVRIGGFAEINGYDHNVPLNFDCSGASCDGSLATGTPVPGVYTTSELTLQTDGSSYAINGNPPVQSGGGRYDNQFWIHLANSIIAEADEVLDGTSAAGKSTLGTRDNPQIIVITSEVTFSSSIDGAGILVVLDGIHFTSDSHYEGVIIVLTDDCDAAGQMSWGTGNADFFGALVIAGSQPGIADFTVNSNVNYSIEALRNVNYKLSFMRVLSWRDMAF